MTQNVIWLHPPFLLRSCHSPHNWLGKLFFEVNNYFVKFNRHRPILRIRNSHLVQTMIKLIAELATNSEFIASIRSDYSLIPRPKSKFNREFQFLNNSHEIYIEHSLSRFIPIDPFLIEVHVEEDILHILGFQPNRKRTTTSYWRNLGNLF